MSLEDAVEALMSSRWDETFDDTIASSDQTRQREKERERVKTADRGREALFFGGTDRDIKTTGTTGSDLEAARGIDAVYVRRCASVSHCLLLTLVMRQFNGSPRQLRKVSN